MGCVYSNFNGECELWEEPILQNGYDKEGYCICEDDPDPSVLCEMYESDGN